jgi:type I restriction enzyme S subunit
MKPGYKQTEVGVIPEDWEYQTILELSQQIIDYRGRTPKKLGMEWGQGDIPALSAGNVKMGYIDFSQECYVGSKALYKRWMTQGEVKKNDIIFTTEAPLGNVALIPDEREYILSQRTILLQIAPEYASSYFIFQIMLSTQFQKVLADYSSGSTAKGIQRKKFEQLPIPLPPLPEQRAIAAALSDVDALLAGLEQLIAKKRDLKQAAMQQLLTGQTRLPGFDGAWEVKRLGEVCKITTGNKDVNEGNPDGQFPFFTCSRSHTFSDSYSFDTEAILVAGNGEVGNLHYFHGKFEAYQRTYVLYTFSADVNYIWQQLNEHLSDSLGLGKIGSSIPYIKKENLIEFEFKSPRDPAEQIAIAAVLSDMDAELAALETQLHKTRAIKQGMMQELLTGKIRLIARGDAENAE